MVACCLDHWRFGVAASASAVWEKIRRLRNEKIGRQAVTGRK